MSDLNLNPRIDGLADLLDSGGMNDFAALWEIQADWVEPPNQGRGGWSGVVRLEIPRPDNEPVIIYLKRQENYTTRSWRHPLRGEPTLKREWRNLEAFHKAGIPTQANLVYGQRHHQGQTQALLITESLESWQPLGQFLLAQEAQGWAAPACDRQVLLRKVAELVAKMHAHHFVHGAMYAKHIFVRARDGECQACFIDLEKARGTRRQRHAAVKDLSQLYRRTPVLEQEDFQYLFNAYAAARGIAVKPLVEAVMKRSEGRQFKNSTQPVS